VTRLQHLIKKNIARLLFPEKKQQTRTSLSRQSNNASHAHHQRRGRRRDRTARNDEDVARRRRRQLLRWWPPAAGSTGWGPTTAATLDVIVASSGETQGSCCCLVSGDDDDDEDSPASSYRRAFGRHSSSASALESGVHDADVIIAVARGGDDKARCAWCAFDVELHAGGSGPAHVRDANGKLVRNSNNVGGGDGGRGGGRGGGREGGRGGGGRGGGGRGGGTGNPRLVTSKLTSAALPEDVLSVVRDNLHELNHIHVSTAFNKLGKMAKWRDLSPRHLTADDGFQELLRLTRDFAKNGQFMAQSLANTTHGIAKLHAAGRLGGLDGSVDDALAALESDAVRVAPYMKPQELSNTVYAYSVLGRMPGDDTWAALEAAAGRVAAGMEPQHVANTVWGYATLGRIPGDKAWAALESAAVRVAPDMDPQNLANTVWGYATLKRMPMEETWAALESAARRVAPEMIAQNLANLVWAYTTLATLRDFNLPSSYAAVWKLVCDMEARDFADEQLRMLFHAHLMQTSFLSSQVTANVSTPGWLTVEARDAWMRNVRDVTTLSRSHRELAKTFDELGVRHEVEHVTDDGYFSIDIYLPEHDVAVEVDGPSHYYHNDSHSSSRGGGGDDDNSPASTRMTAKPTSSWPSGAPRF
jgi:hypothetical protein